MSAGSPSAGSRELVRVKDGYRRFCPHRPRGACQTGAERLLSVEAYACIQPSAGLRCRRELSYDWARVPRAWASRKPPLVATATGPMLLDGGAGLGNWEVRLVGGYWRRLGDRQEDRAYEPPTVLDTC